MSNKTLYKITVRAAQIVKPFNTQDALQTIKALQSLQIRNEHVKSICQKAAFSLAYAPKDTSPEIILDAINVLNSLQASNFEVVRKVLCKKALKLGESSSPDPRSVHKASVAFAKMKKGSIDVDLCEHLFNLTIDTIEKYPHDKGLRLALIHLYPIIGKKIQHLNEKQLNTLTASVFFFSVSSLNDLKGNMAWQGIHIYVIIADVFSWCDFRNRSQSHNRDRGEDEDIDDDFFIDDNKPSTTEGDTFMELREKLLFYVGSVNVYAMSAGSYAQFLADFLKEFWYCKPLQAVVERDLVTTGVVSRFNTYDLSKICLALGKVFHSDKMLRGNAEVYGFAVKVLSDIIRRLSVLTRNDFHSHEAGFRLERHAMSIASVWDLFSSIISCVASMDVCYSDPTLEKLSRKLIQITDEYIQKFPLAREDTAWVFLCVATVSQSRCYGNPLQELLCKLYASYSSSAVLSHQPLLGYPIQEANGRETLFTKDFISSAAAVGENGTPDYAAAHSLTQMFLGLSQLSCKSSSEWNVVKLNQTNGQVIYGRTQFWSVSKRNELNSVFFTLFNWMDQVLVSTAGKSSTSSVAIPFRDAEYSLLTEGFLNFFESLQDSMEEAPEMLLTCAFKFFSMLDALQIPSKAELQTETICDLIKLGIYLVHFPEAAFFSDGLEIHCLVVQMLQNLTLQPLFGFSQWGDLLHKFESITATVSKLKKREINLESPTPLNVKNAQKALLEIKTFILRQLCDASRFVNLLDKSNENFVSLNLCISNAECARRLGANIVFEYKSQYLSNNSSQFFFILLFETILKNESFFSTQDLCRILRLISETSAWKKEAVISQKSLVAFFDLLTEKEDLLSKSVSVLYLFNAYTALQSFAFFPDGKLELKLLRIFNEFLSKSFPSLRDRRQVINSFLDTPQLSAAFKKHKNAVDDNMRMLRKNFNNCVKLLDESHDVQDQNMTSKRQRELEASPTEIEPLQTISSSKTGGNPFPNVDFDAVLQLAKQKKRKYETTSFSLAPPAVLPLWQRICSSAVGHLKRHESDRRACQRPHLTLKQQLKAYHASVQAREEKLRAEQEEARLRAGLKICNQVSLYWNRRGDCYQQLLKVEFDVVKRKRDARKQEDMLRETELLTKKLLSSILNKTEEKNTEHGSSSDELEVNLSLLDTQKGKRPLRSYQRSALKWMIHLFENNLNGILADEMGLGKTVQTIALLCYFAEYRNDWGPHLVVVPTTVVLNWKAEFQRWAPGLKVKVYIGSQKERRDVRKGWFAEDAFHVCITSYNLVVRDRTVFRKRPWGFLVLDEAHQVKNFMSKKWQSLFDLQAQYRLLLTGTPLQNSMMELWSLFHFLLPFASAFKSNEDFKEWFSNPLDEMVTGRASLNEEIVSRLQALLRPFMLRRLKKDVEWQLPSKSEKVVMCNLSRRQRFLYDEYMQLAETKEKITKGGAGGVLGVLLALRKVCDHPDLFEERPTQTPLAIDLDKAISLSVPRDLLLLDNVFTYRFPAFYGSVNAGLNLEDANLLSQKDKKHESWSSLFKSSYLEVNNDSSCYGSLVDKESLLKRLAPELLFSTSPDEKTEEDEDLEFLAWLSTTWSAFFHNKTREQSAIKEARVGITKNIQRLRQIKENTIILSYYPRLVTDIRGKLKDSIIKQQHAAALCPTITERVNAMLSSVHRFCFYIPAVIVRSPPSLHCHSRVRHFKPFRSPNYADLSSFIGFLMRAKEDASGGRLSSGYTYNASSFLRELWPIYSHRLFDFPDRHLIIYDCGKLQFLKGALQDLKKGGHRMLIFTQFTAMLNILEKFLALISVSYLRLDGSTKTETRQHYVDRFNEDERITCMILSTRSGGIGLNLTGADTVIFYDSDWNPTMDLQAQDRCHRIGQTRPVTIYRLISTHTVEESILEKARERKRLNNLVIRGGQFHAIAGVDESYEDSSAAYAALSAPVNLRSFFHDLDEDATVEVDNKPGENTVTEGDFLLQMRDVEDDVDRIAQMQVENELNERERENEEEYDLVKPDAGVTASADTEIKGIAHVLLRGDGTDCTNVEDSLRAAEESLRIATRTRQRNLLKSHSSLNQLLTVNYGSMHSENAEDRYGRVFERFAEQMEEDLDILPPFRPNL